VIEKWYIVGFLLCICLHFCIWFLSLILILSIWRNFNRISITFKYSSVPFRYVWWFISLSVHGILSKKILFLSNFVGFAFYVTLIFSRSGAAAICLYISVYCFSSYEKLLLTYRRNLCWSRGFSDWIFLTQLWSFVTFDWIFASHDLDTFSVFFRHVLNFSIYRLFIAAYSR